jgi:hypothetical protein
MQRKRLVLGFQGSSVMSGQDNCFDFNYANTMRRQLARLLAFAGVDVEVRNMGQNGDGPDMGTQMLCAPDTLGPDVDVLTLWYPMIPGPGYFEAHTFLQRVMLRSTVVHSINFPKSVCARLGPFAQPTPDGAATHLPASSRTMRAAGPRPPRCGPLWIGSQRTRTCARSPGSPGPGAGRLGRVWRVAHAPQARGRALPHPH